MVVGNITPEEAKAVIEQYFGDWKAEGPKPETEYPPVAANKPMAVLVPNTSRVQDEVRLVETVGLTRSHPDYYALQVGLHVLTGAFYATRLYHDLRENNGLVYAVDAFLDAGKTRAVFGVYYGCDPRNVSKAHTIITRDLTDMQTIAVTPEELARAKNLLVHQILLANTSTSGTAMELLHLSQMDLPLDEPFRAARKFEEITALQVKGAFLKWIRPKDFVQVTSGPEPQ